MGQKVNPIGLRVGIIRDWESKWYANKLEVPTLLHEDLKIREIIQEFYKKAYVSKIEIERTKTKIMLTIHTAKPGVVIGRDGAVKAQIVEKLQKMTGKTIFLSVVEIKNPDLDAILVARNMAEQLENRASFRRVQKMAIQRSMKAGAKGIRTSISGRLGGAEMARREGYSEGTVPLHTLRADIDYAIAEANTTYGKLGVKVWICKGEVLPDKKTKKEAN
ncbi:MAG TPA: 30S ribosomal protein S3 [Bacilli bacterium]|jgi:small subunit ribosomal protein S3|nr:30S ribosomal protein S3 [Bacilli bacterium]NLT01166.1 30S ribosomal protein S3 [Acholeplasmataceae bacterium]HNZ77424.1 30S ribosomal protein S3 [Bacilli bacterium]HOD61589.1 30S ribosomal protein S3 [Bacilli bacterium]HOE06492.1 30S ribosomal protein S3 [Bacilli bacterium]